MSMNLLTTRKLPVWTTPAADNHKFRIDSALIGMVHSAVSMKNPKLKIGKRFAIELALTQWLHSEGLLEERLEVPELKGVGNGSHN